MAESVTIARPYAEAVFLVAKEGGALPVWSKRLAFLALVVEDPAMHGVIGNPAFSVAEITRTILSLTDDKDQQLAGFVGELARNERLIVLPEIHSLFEELKSAEEGVHEAVIYSAFPIESPQLDDLTQQLERHFKLRLSPRLVVDETLIGGIKVAVGDQVLDASIRGRLEAMHTLLMN